MAGVSQAPVAARTDRCGADTCSEGGCGTSEAQAKRIVWLQWVTVAWMLVECAVALFASWQARSTALLAFGADSLIELLSASVVLLQFTTWFRLSEIRAAKLAGVLLYLLAGVVTATALASLVLGVKADCSNLGMGITVAALIAMPLLSWAKRRMAIRTGNAALAADAVQSATCAYLAAMTLAGLAINAVFHLPWVDSVAALGAVPLLCVEAARAMRGEPCGC